MSMCDNLHKLFNRMKKYDSTNFDSIPFKRGIYIFLDPNEKYKGMDRIVRVGTHATSPDKTGLIIDRLHSHFKGNRKCSIFRKNIGRAIIAKENKDKKFLEFWNADDSTPFKSLPNYNDLLILKKQIELKISEYLKKLYFVVIPFENWQDRDRYETGLISALCQCSDFKASSSWLGNNVPNGMLTKIAKNRLWCSAKSDKDPLSDKEYDRLEKICKEYFKC